MSNASANIATSAKNTSQTILRDRELLDLIEWLEATSDSIEYTFGLELKPDELRDLVDDAASALGAAIVYLTELREAAPCRSRAMTVAYQASGTARPRRRSRKGARRCSVSSTMASR